MRKIEVIGHRGARAFAPENTVAGMAKGLAIGVDWVDVDVVVTSDRVLVAYHNLVINPEILCDEDDLYLANDFNDFLESLVGDSIDKLLIKNLSFTELKKYQIRLNPHSNYAQFFPKQEIIPKTLINSLQEIVDYVDRATNKSVKFQIEIKNNLDHISWSYSPQELANIIYQFILQNDLIERVKIQAFDWRILIALNELDPKIKTAYLFIYDLLDNWQKWFQHTRIFELAQNHPINVPGDFLPIIKQLGAYSFEPEDNELKESEIKLAHQLGLKVYVWGYPEHSGFVFNAKLMRYIINLGVDGIITDNPVELNKLLVEMGQTSPRRFNEEL